MVRFRGVCGLFVSLFFAMVFTYAFLYVTFSFPLVVDRFLMVLFPDYPFDLWFEVELFLTPYGWLALVVVVVFIVLGFMFKATYLSKLGVLSLYLPVFGYFAFAMFLLAGLGFLRILWLPIIQLAPEVLRLGSIILLPYKTIVDVVNLIVYTNKYWVAYIISKVICTIGGMVFFTGIFTWLYGKFNSVKLIDFWIYKFSRHPQYLGFIIWSYGVLAYIAFKQYVKGAFTTPPTLIWLSMTAIILLIAVKEEGDMIRKLGNKYLSYIEKTPFLIPLPKLVSKALTIPHKLLKWTPGDLGKSLAIILIYLVPLIVIPPPI